MAIVMIGAREYHSRVMGARLSPLGEAPWQTQRRQPIFRLPVWKERKKELVIAADLVSRAFRQCFQCVLPPSTGRRSNHPPSPSIIHRAEVPEAQKVDDVGTVHH